MTLSLERHAASRLLLTLGVAVVAALAGACTTNTDGNLDTTSSALTAAEGDGADAATNEAARTACLTDFVGCIRAGDDEATCGRELHECMPRPPKRGGHGGGGDCDRDGAGPRPPMGDGDGPPPPPGADGGDAPPPPPGMGDGDRPPPPPPGGPGGPGGDGGAPPGAEAHRACHESLVTCAKGTDAVDVCVSTAVACFEAAGPPPPPPPPPRGGGDAPAPTP